VFLGKDKGGSKAIKKGPAKKKIGDARELVGRSEAKKD
jgi:hypothetical protein